MTQSLFTIKEIADALGYSKPSISKAISELGIDPDKKGRSFVLTKDQARSIAEYFNTSFEVKNDPKETKGSSKEIEALEKTISILEKQLEVKDKQIEELGNTVSNLIDTNKALSASIAMYEAKVLFADPEQAETEIKNDIEESSQDPKEEKKKGFFARLFGI